MFLLLVFRVTRYALRNGWWFAEFSVNAFRSVSTPQVLVIPPLVVLLLLLPTLLFQNAEGPSPGSRPSSTPNRLASATSTHTEASR